jgi:subtilisin family serine protease
LPRLGSLAGLTALIALLAAFSAPAHSTPADAVDSESDTLIPGHYIVVLEDSVDRPGEVARAQTSANDGRLGFVYSHALNGYSAELSDAAVQALRNDPRVKYVTPDRRVQADAQTIPTGFKRVFALANKKLVINEVNDAAVNADVAVLDTGIDSKHADLNVLKLTDCMGEKCVEGKGEDDNSHGTHVAGSLGAIDNTVGVVGVALGVRLWGVKVLDKNGEGTQATVTAGVDWVTSKAKDIEVANLSLGCECSQPTLEEAIKNSVAKGVVYVVAAGNEAANAEKFSPAKNPAAITVGAIADYDGEPGAKSEVPPCNLTKYKEEWGVEKDDSFANFSNWGSVVDIVAPGVCIRSTVPGGGYAIEGWWGTSMAAPHVAGAAAMLAGVSNPETKADVEAIGKTILEKGNKNWTAEHEGAQQPLLDISNETVFHP